MAASSNPGGGKGNQDGGPTQPNPSNNNQNHSNSSNNINNNNSAVAAAGAENSLGLQALKHDPGLAQEWSAEEQSILDENLGKLSGEQNLLKYVKIATHLPEKTVRDVALRCRWMSKKESGKRRKAEEQNPAKKIKDRKEKTVDPSAKPAVPPVARSAMPMYTQVIPEDDGISYEAIGGSTGQLLQQNAHIFSQITANLQSYQFQDNIDLFCQTRNNIATILNEMNDMPGIMSQMPPLSVNVNDDLADTILPKLPQVSASLQS
uniref:Myb-like domain-containing protein n=1 Tax=Araucaria cunninghamii TaxID=56994 RepID=A0A0D6R3H0_ARACU